MQGGGVYLVDLMCWMTNQRPIDVRSAGNRIATAGTRFRCPDFVRSTFRCREGMIGVVSANFGCAHRHQHVVRVFGTKGTFLYDDMGARIYRERDTGGPAEVLSQSPLPVLAGIADRDRGTSETALDLRVIGTCLASDYALSTDTLREIDPR